MADVHDLLSRNAREHGEGQKISARALLEKLMPVLNGTGDHRHLHLDVEDTILPSRIGTALAMITNELVNNAIKHGAGDIEVTFHTKKNEAEIEAVLTVRDHGTGFPIGFVPAMYDDTGIELVQSLAGWTLRGRVRYENAPDGGACVTVTFNPNT